MPHANMSMYSNFSFCYTKHGGHRIRELGFLAGEDNTCERSNEEEAGSGRESLKTVLHIAEVLASSWKSCEGRIGG